MGPTRLPVAPEQPVREAGPRDSAPARLRRLLAESAGGPSDARRVEIGLEILDILSQWRAGGGEVRLEAAIGGQAPAVVTRLADHVRPTPTRGMPGVDGGQLLQSVLDGMVFSTDDEVEVLRLHAAIRDSDRWRALSREVQRGVVALCVARLRRLQDDRRLIHPRLEECFSMLTAFSKREQPGYVVGLSRHHHPVRGTWQEDAEAWTERLRAMTVPEAPGEAPDPSLDQVTIALVALERADNGGRESAERALHEAVRGALAGGVAATDPRLVRALGPVASLFHSPEFAALRRALAAAGDETSDVVPGDWAWFGRTRGRRAVIVGGEPSEPVRQAVQRTFQLSELEWIPTASLRTSLQSVRDRVRAGRIDLVLVATFAVGHEPDEILLPACRERGVDCLHVDRGIEPERVRGAIERYLPVA